MYVYMCVYTHTHTHIHDADGFTRPIKYKHILIRGDITCLTNIKEHLHLYEVSASDEDKELVKFCRTSKHNVALRRNHTI